MSNHIKVEKHCLENVKILYLFCSNTVNTDVSVSGSIMLSVELLQMHFCPVVPHLRIRLQRKRTQNKYDISEGKKEDQNEKYGAFCFVKLLRKVLKEGL